MIVSLQSVTKYFGSDLIIEDCTENIEPAQRIGIIGPNGAGKIHPPAADYRRACAG